MRQDICWVPAAELVGQESPGVVFPREGGCWVVRHPLIRIAGSAPEEHYNVVSDSKEVYVPLVPHLLKDGPDRQVAFAFQLSQCITDAARGVFPQGMAAALQRLFIGSPATLSTNPDYPNRVFIGAAYLLRKV